MLTSKRKRAASSTNKLPSANDSLEDFTSESSSETCYSHDEESVSKRSKNLPAVALVAEDEDEEWYENERVAETGYTDEAEFVALMREYKAKREAEGNASASASSKKKKQKAVKKTLPTTLEMARELGIRWIGSIDPGTTNAAFMVLDAQTARIVYWRVFKLDEIVELCETQTHVTFDKNANSRSDKKLDKQLYAVSWWCQQDSCPFKKCDLVLIERQSFTRNMKGVESTWAQAFAAHKPAVLAPAYYENGKEQYTLYACKPLIVSGQAVKTHFKGFFKHAQANGQQVMSAFGVGDVDGDEQYRQENKKNAKYWGLKSIGAHVDDAKRRLKSKDVDVMTESAANDFQLAALEEFHTMTPRECAETEERLAGAKSDDLFDVFFQAFYGADVVVPMLWKRVHGPRAKNGYKTRYTFMELPKAVAMSGDVEARHQCFFSYLKGRVKLASNTLKKIKESL